MTGIPDNTFAAACYDQNTVEELMEALSNGPDEQDMRDWSLTADEWRAQVALALAEKRALASEGEN